MKLEKSIKQVQKIPELDILKMENKFLNDQLKLQKFEQSLELVETIFDCIEKEGAVSSSIETMFGENFSSKDTIFDEIKEFHSNLVDATLTKEDLKKVKTKISEMKKVKSIIKHVVQTKESDTVSIPVTEKFTILIPDYYLGNSENDKEYRFVAVEGFLYCLTLASHLRGGGFLGLKNEIRLDEQAKNSIDALKNVVNNLKYIKIYYPFEDENFATVYKNACAHMNQLQDLINRVWELYYDHFDKENARDIAYFSKLRTSLYAMATACKTFCDQSERLVEFINSHKYED